MSSDTVTVGDSDIFLFCKWSSGSSNLEETLWWPVYCEYPSSSCLANILFAMSALKNVSSSCAFFKREEDVDRMSGQSTRQQYHATEQPCSLTQQQVLLSIQFCTVSCNWAMWHSSRGHTENRWLDPRNMEISVDGSWKAANRPIKHRCAQTLIFLKWCSMNFLQLWLQLQNVHYLTSQYFLWIAFKDDIISRTETELNEDQTILHRQSNTVQHPSEILLLIPIQLWYLTSVFSGDFFFILYHQEMMMQFFKKLIFGFMTRNCNSRSKLPTSHNFYFW